jgi:hypothetical protein
MYKIKSSLLALFGLLLMTQFQNCAPPSEMRAASEMKPVEGLKQLDLEKDPVVVKPATQKTHYDPLLADRRYLISLFTDVFGPKAVNVDSTGTRFLTQEHGSPCSIYRTHNQYDAKTGKWVEADVVERCSTNATAFLSAPLNPTPTVSRQALLTHACSDLTSNDTTLGYALKKISNDRVPASTSANVIKAYRLFYRDKKDPQASLTDSLLVMLPLDQPAKDDWRNVMFTICASGFWQIL